MPTFANVRSGPDAFPNPSPGAAFITAQLLDGTHAPIAPTIYAKITTHSGVAGPGVSNRRAPLADAETDRRRQDGATAVGRASGKGRRCRRARSPARAAGMWLVGLARAAPVGGPRPPASPSTGRRSTQTAADLPLHMLIPWCARDLIRGTHGSWGSRIERCWTWSIHDRHGPGLAPRMDAQDQ